VSACATSGHAVGDALRIIQHGEADLMIAGGAEAAITPLALASFANMKALSERNDDPATASRPFDKDRDGFVMGDGAGAVILEEWEHAQRRGAKIYAEAAGYGMTADAYHITAPAPDGAGAQDAMRLAMKDGGIRPEEVGYINAHGTSTPYGDAAETAAARGGVNPGLQRISEKVARGERLSRDDGLALFQSPDLLTLGALADLANRRANSDRVFFAANQHINPTNVCVLRNTCVFCSFARMPQEEGAYTRSLDEVFAEADAARDNPTREFHIVGGLHPKLRLAYYVDMFRGLKARHPTV